MPEKVWVLNLLVFAVLLEADLGRRKIGWFRVLRPLIGSASIIPLFLTSVPTSGHNLTLQVVGVGVGVALGLACHLLLSVGVDPDGRPMSRAGLGYAAFWAVIFGGRLLFVYGTEHWFARQLGQFLVIHQLSADGLSNALVFMAIAMALARSALLGVRGRAAAGTAPRHPALGPGRTA